MTSADMQRAHQWTDEISRLMAAGRMADAVGAAKQFLAAFPNLPMADYCMGYTLGAAGHPGPAFPHLRAAAMKEPANPEFLARFGQAALDVNNILVAEPALKRAIELKPSLIPARLSLAEYYARTAKPEKAGVYYRDILASPNLPGDKRAAIQSDFAVMRIQAGLTDEVAEELRPQVESGNCSIGVLLSYLACGKSKLGSAEDKLLDAALARSNVPAELASKLTHYKARILHNSKQYEEAYKMFRRAKALRADKSDAVAPLRGYTDAVIKSITREAVEQLAAEFGDKSFAPVFVVGLPRSGTTLTETIIAAHSKAGGAGELVYIDQMQNMVLGQGNVSTFAARMRAIGLPRLAAIINEIRRAMDYLGGGALHVVDKMPHNFARIMVIKSIFPRARIIHCFRDPADNFLSTFTASLNDYHRFGDDPAVYADYYREYARLMQHWYRLFPDAIFPSSYEALVSNPTARITEMLAFLGLAPEEDCFHPERSSKSVRTASALQLRNPINASSVGRWKSYETQLAVIHEKLGPEINTFGAA